MEAGRIILVVDDVAMFRELECVFLARCGRLMTAASGAEALEIIHGDPRPDVVVLDLTLPDADGEAICREIKSDPETKHIAVIAVTPSGEAADHARAVHAGADDVLSKPLSRVKLVEAVNRFVRFEPPRGLARVDLQAPVRLLLGDQEVTGRIRNLSRGGVFVESDVPVALHAELQVDFDLPETGVRVVSQVQVVWLAEPASDDTPGLGLRFVDLDRELARVLDDYVHERAEATPSSRGAQSQYGRAAL